MKKAISVLISCLMATSLLAGCKNDADNNNVTEKEDYTVSLLDFEKWAPDFQLVRIVKNFGKITRNNDKNFVKTGEYSAKIQPMGGTSLDLGVSMYFPTKSTLFDFDYSDFSNVYNINLWMYNTAETERSVSVGAVTKIDDLYTFSYSTLTSVKLPSNEWYNINIPVDSETLGMQLDVHSVFGLSFSFDKAGTRDVESIPAFYLDDVVLSCYGESVETRDLVELDKNEVCDFEKLWQQFIVKGSSENAAYVPAPDVDVVRAYSEAENLLSASSGDYVLKVTAHPSVRETITNKTYQRFTLPATILQHTGIASIPQEEWDKVHFYFDVYNPSNSEQVFTLEWNSTKKYNGTILDFKIGAKKWTTVSWTLAEIAAKSGNRAASTYRITLPGSFGVAWGEFTGKENKVWYFDNFRLQYDE